MENSGKIFDRAVHTLEQNQKRRKEGKFNCIPTPFERMEEYLPGIERATYYIVTASSGIGKSKFAKYFFVMRSYEFAKANPDTKFKIFYFCLEESKENFIHSLMCHKLYRDHGIVVPIKQLKSILKSPYLSDYQLDKIKAMREYFHKFEDVVEIIDDIRHPTGIYYHVKNYAEKHGRWIMKEGVRNGKSAMVKDYYKADHPDEYVLIATDHLAHMHNEKGASKHETIGKFSAEYCVSMRDDYGYTIINIQQQAADKERQEFTYRGQSIEAKLEPSLDGLGDNKMTQRDADIVLGLFAPDRYQIRSHRHYNIAKWQDNYRSLIVLKNRDGTPNTRLGLYFNGAVNYFEQLPKSDEIRSETYKKYGIE